MNPERWAQIEELFHRATECDAEQRAALLDEACRGDVELRRQVETLLASEETANDDIQAAVRCELEAVTFPLVGEIISHYRILDGLGRGGMGSVYRAEDIKLGRQVALKFLPEESTKNPAALRRFEREARAASALEHPNICPIYEFGEHEGQPFLAMQLLKGQTLREVISSPDRARVPHPVDELLDLAIQIAGGLEAAHSHGIIHRDIKPANIFLTSQGQAVILDFGLAKLFHSEAIEDECERTPHDFATVRTQANWKVIPAAGDPHASLTGAAIGTAGYMSPEQLRGERLDARTDLFSFGVVLYEVATGKRPFTGDTSGVTFDAILSRQPVPPAGLDPKIPQKLEEIINKCLEKDRKLRCQSAAEIRADLQRLKRDTETGKTAAATAATLHGERNRNLWLGIGVGAPLIVIAAAVWGIYRQFGPKPPPFQQIEITQLTTNGKVKTAAISPDGKYVAYAVDEGGVFDWLPSGQESLWVRQVAGGDVQVAPAATVGYWGLTFSRDGDSLYVVRSEGKTLGLSYLYKIPILGGVEKRLIRDVAGGVTLSPDGKELAFIRAPVQSQTELVVAHEDGSAERKLAERKMPLGLWSPAWSPNGETIAATAYDYQSNAGLMSAVEFSIRGAPEHPLTSKRWSWLGNLTWLSDGRGFIVNTKELTSTLMQVGYLSYPSGEARRITSDTNEYEGLSLTADSRTLATVQEKSSFDTWVAPFAEAESGHPVTSGGRSDHEAWTPDGKIVYDTLAEQGSINIWVMEPDGSKAKRLTVNSGRMNKGARVSPDGRYIAFVSDRTGSAHIWRMDMDGNNATQLTNSPSDLLWFGSPDYTPDGKWVVYPKGGVGDTGIWKVPIAGGDPVRLSTTPEAIYPAVSPDGAMLASVYIDDTSGKSGIEITSLEGGVPAKQFEILMRGTIRWMPDSRSVLYIKDENGVSNIWSQPISGAPPKQITHFNSEVIRSFDLSRDGKQIVMSRGTANRDVVLIRDVK